MKKNLISIFLVFLFPCVYSQEGESLKQPIAKFNSRFLDLDKVYIGEIVIDSFIVSNIGSAPLIIKDVKPNCGCTVTEYTKQPIMSNKEGFIKVKYTAGSHVKKFVKSLVVITNTYEKNYFLMIKGEVVE